MKRLTLAPALALVLGLGSAGRADAQIIYGYTAPAPGGIVQRGAVVVPGGVKTYQNYFSPFTGTVQQQFQYSDVFGRSFGQTTGFNTITGTGFTTGFVNPGFFPGPVYPLVPFVPARPLTEFESFQLYRRGIFAR